MQKQQPSPGAQDPASQEGSALSFVPAGTARSIAEYAVASLPGAILLFSFFLAAQASVLFLKGSDMMPATFLPVICIMPLISGAVSALVLEKIRSKQITVRRGAMVGFFAGLLGVTLSSILLGIAKLVTHESPFGKFLESGWLVLAALVVVVALDAVLSAVGGAIAAKVVKD